MADEKPIPLLDGLLDFVSVELLGCAMPRQKQRPPAMIEQPMRRAEAPPFEVDQTIDRSTTTWSNGYQSGGYR